jgi:hypothetical protein
MFSGSWLWPVRTKPSYEKPCASEHDMP